MVDAAEAVLLGLIQGLTEWLPISSSAHLALAQYFFGINAGVAFDIVLHLGTVAAVIAYYHKDIGRLIYGTLQLREAELRAVSFIILAAIPTAIIGFMFKGFFESMFFQPLYVCAALLVTGVFLIIAEKYSTEAKVNEIKRTAIGSPAFATKNLEAKIRAMEKKEVGSKEAFIIGIAQGIAVAPGISRSGATIGTGIALGVRREEVARFSFLAAIIPILGAGILEGRDALATNIDILPVILGFAVSAIVGYASIGILISFLKQSRLRWFGYYCIALGVAVLAILLMRMGMA